MFNYIINPITNQKISVYSNQGKQLLKQYITEFNGGMNNNNNSQSFNNCMDDAEFKISSDNNFLFRVSNDNEYVLIDFEMFDNKPSQINKKNIFPFYLGYVTLDSSKKKEITIKDYLDVSHESGVGVVQGWFEARERFLNDRLRQNSLDLVKDPVSRYGKGGINKTCIFHYDHLENWGELIQKLNPKMKKPKFEKVDQEEKIDTLVKYKEQSIQRGRFGIYLKDQNNRDTPNNMETNLIGKVNIPVIILNTTEYDDTQLRMFLMYLKENDYFIYRSAMKFYCDNFETFKKVKVLQDLTNNNKKKRKAITMSNVNNNNTNKRKATISNVYSEGKK